MAERRQAQWTPPFRTLFKNRGNLAGDALRLEIVGRGSLAGRRSRKLPAMNLDEIRTCLTADGWPVETVSETTMQSRFRGKARIFPMLVHLDRTFVTFAVLPYAHAPEDHEDADELFKQLLRYNRQ